MKTASAWPSPKKFGAGWVLLLVLSVLLLGGLFLFLAGTPANEPLVFDDDGISGCENLNRSAYRLPSAVFEQLPKPPNCFFSIVTRYHNKQFSDDFFFTRDFFLQPEFYPSFERDGLPYWKTPIVTHWGAIGFGAFPFERSLEIKPGETVLTRFFFHSGFGVRSFQGLRLEPRFENPLDAEWIGIELDSESQNGFLLGPSFPKFDANWAKAIDVKITARSDAMPRQVRLVLVTRAPSPEKDLAWSQQFVPYYPVTSFVGAQTAMRVSVKVD